MNVTLFLVINISGMTLVLTYHNVHFIKGNDEPIYSVGKKLLTSDAYSAKFRNIILNMTNRHIVTHRQAYLFLTPLDLGG